MMRRRQPLEAVRREFLRGLALITAMTGFYSLLSLTVPIFDYIANHRVTESRSFDTLGIAAGIAIFCMFGYGILEYARAQVGLVLADRVSRILTIPALEAVVAGGPGPLAAQAVRDVTDLRNFAGSGAVTTLADLLWSPLFVFVLFRLHPVYGWGTLISAAVMLVFSWVSDRATRDRLIRANTVVGAALADIGDVLSKAETIEGLGMTSAVASRAQRTLGQALAIHAGADNRAKLFAAAGTGLRNGLGIAVFASGAVAVLHQEAAPISIIIANMLMMRALAPYGALLINLREWGFARASWGRVEKLLSSPSHLVIPSFSEGSLRDEEHQERHQSSGNRSLASLGMTRGEDFAGESALIVEDLSYAPPRAGRKVIDGVSFTLEPGDILGIAGASGAGKSTLARLITGAALPSSGQVRIEGLEGSIGYLPQDVQLLDTAIGDNIARLEVDGSAEVLTAARAASVHDLIGRLKQGYDTPIAQGGYALSGGQRQRLGLARALYRAPRLLVLDEPNSHLDQEGETALILAIQAAAKAGSIVILISHKPALMAAVTKIMVLEAGRIQQMGPRPDILATG